MGYGALIIPVDPEEPIHRRELNSLASLQAEVGGDIEAVPFHGDERVTTYVNEEGKFVCEPNARATALMGPGLFAGDFIAGTLVVCGFDPEKGENIDLPADFEERWVGKPRTLPEPRIARENRSVSFSWVLSEEASEQHLTILACSHRAAGISVLSSCSHPNEFYATLRNETHEKRGSRVVSRTFRLGGGALVAREPVTRFSAKRLEAFALAAPESLLARYGESDERVTKYFAVQSGGSL